MAENLYRKATGEGREAVTAAIFWLKARARWKEVSVNEHSGIDGAPIEQVTKIQRIIVSPPDRPSPGSPSGCVSSDAAPQILWESTPNR